MDKGLDGLMKQEGLIREAFSENVNACIIDHDKL